MNKNKTLSYLLLLLLTLMLLGSSFSCRLEGRRDEVVYVYPKDGSIDVPTDFIMMWEDKVKDDAKSDVKYNVYLGEKPENLTLIASDLSQNELYVRNLDAGKSYFLRIEKIGDKNREVEGKIISFKTFKDKEPEFITSEGKVNEKVVFLSSSGRRNAISIYNTVNNEKRVVDIVGDIDMIRISSDKEKIVFSTSTYRNSGSCFSLYYFNLRNNKILNILKDYHLYHYREEGKRLLYNFSQDGRFLAIGYLPYCNEEEIYIIGRDDEYYNDEYHLLLFDFEKEETIEVKPGEPVFYYLINLLVFPEAIIESKTVAIKDSYLGIYNIVSKEFKDLMSFKNHTVKQVAFSPDGNYLAVSAGEYDDYRRVHSLELFVYNNKTSI